MPGQPEATKATTADPGAEFLELLGSSRSDGVQVAQYVYAYLTIHALGGTDKNIRRDINNEALFWNTVLGSLQTSIFIVLGRVFDPNNQQSPYAILRRARQAQNIFSLDSLRARKKTIFGENEEAMSEYMEGLRAPTEAQFRRLERALQGYKKIYDDDYRDIRNKVFAHRIFTGQKVSELFSKTNITDLQRIATFLDRFHSSWTDTYNNGTRLTLHRKRSSVTQMLEHPPGKKVVKPISEEMVVATARVLKSIGIESPIKKPELGETEGEI